MIKSTATSSTTAPYYSQCGAGGLHILEIRLSPPSVLLRLDDGHSVELHAGTWDYLFNGDKPLELQFVSDDEDIAGWVCKPGSTSQPLERSGGVLCFICGQPSDDGELEFELEFAADKGLDDATRSQPQMEEGPRDICSTSAQPTLIIRTKKSCPTGSVNKSVEDPVVVTA